MAQSAGSPVSGTVRPFNTKYGGDFENAMNELYSPKNIKNTAQQIVSLEKQYGPFTLGKFNRYLIPPGTLPANFDFDEFEADFNLIPEYIRQRATDLMRANFASRDPLPIFTKVSENVDRTHDIIIKPFLYNGAMYVGVLFLCPNTKRPP